MKTVTSVKIDKDTKEQASKLAASMGLSLSAVINATLKQFVTEQRISFSVEPELNEKNKKALRAALADVKKSSELVGPFSDVNSLKKSLSS